MRTKNTTKKPTICSRGHRFVKSSKRPVCPRCWPGYYTRSARGKRKKD